MLVSRRSYTASCSRMCTICVPHINSSLCRMQRLQLAAAPSVGLKEQMLVYTIFSKPLKQEHPLQSFLLHQDTPLPVISLHNG
jgi:hypothetical protein